MSVGFRNITKCQTREKISASGTTIMLENTADYVPFISSPGDYVYAVLRDQYNKEIIKIDVSASSIYGLSVERGQENTSARSWNRGTLFYQDLTADSLELLRQKEVFRTVTYNPNGLTAPAYAYEKIYQTGATECEKRWWKAVNDTNLVWVLIAGTICPGETWYPPEDWDWEVPPDWEWPIIVYQVATPLLIPAGGNYADAQSVDISCATSGATIYYTEDGTEPDDGSTGYTVPVTVPYGNTTLKAIAYRANTVTSEIAVEEYVVYRGAYIFCGWRANNYLQDTDNYVLDSWTSAADCPAPARGLLAASTINEKGYIYCGWDSNPSRDTDEYTPDAWVSKTDCPAPAKLTLAASTINDKGYIYCGYGGGYIYGIYNLQDTDEYTPDTWASKTDCPLPERRALAASTILDKGYIYCGSSPNESKDTDEYTPDTWASKTDCPLPERNYLAASTILGKGYIYCGGTLAGGYLQDTDEYTPDAWVSKTDCPAPARDNLAASTMLDKGYIFCGYGGGYLQDTDEYTPDTWTSKADCPLPARYWLAASTL